MDRGTGARVFDIDGNEYMDFVGSWGPLILGHAHPAVVEAVVQALRKGSSFGAPTLAETELARLVVEMVPSVEKVRLVNSGTEATMSAIRLARAYAGRDGVVKFEGCYHGHADGLLVKAGSGAQTLGVPTSPGVPADYARHTHTLPFNDIDGFAELTESLGREIACVIVEPVAGNMGVVPPKPGFLEGLREITREKGMVLIFDEVMTGFRVAPGGAQALYGVEPDLTTLGKIIGGGLPVGAYGGKTEIMDRVAPVGPTYQAGTLSGNPLAVAAGIATLKALRREGLYEELDRKSGLLVDGLLERARTVGLPVTANRVGSMATLFFTPVPVWDLEGAKGSDLERFARFHAAMLRRGVYFPPSQFEAFFLSAAHDTGHIEDVLARAKAVFQDLIS
jgi:glutamate-1-semialdehyde 2,1-aminomutase